MFTIPVISLRTLLGATLLCAIGFWLYTQIALNIFWTLSVLLALQTAMDAFRVSWTRNTSSQGSKRSLLRSIVSAEFATTLILSIFVLQFPSLEIFQSVYEVRTILGVEWSDSFDEEGISIFLFALGWLGLLASLSASFVQNRHAKFSWLGGCLGLVVVAASVLLVANYTLLWQISALAILRLENARPLLDPPQSTADIANAIYAWRVMSMVCLVPTVLLPFSFLAWRRVEATCNPGSQLPVVWLIIMSTLNIAIAAWIYGIGLPTTSSIWQGSIAILRLSSYVAAVAIAALLSFVIVETRLRRRASICLSQDSELRIWTRSGPWTIVATLIVTLGIVLPVYQYFLTDGMTLETIAALLDDPRSAMLIVRIAVVAFLCQHVLMLGTNRFRLNTSTSEGIWRPLGYSALFLGRFSVLLPV